MDSSFIGSVDRLFTRSPGIWRWQTVNRKNIGLFLYLFEETKYVLARYFIFHKKIFMKSYRIH
jgi:hypothetical protein